MSFQYQELTRFRFQASTTLTNWTSIQTNTSPFTFTDTLATNYPYRFYRAIH